MPLSEEHKEPTAIVACRARIAIGLTTYDCQSFVPDTADTAEPISVVTTAGEFEINLPGVVKKSETMELKVLKQATKPEVGTVADLKIDIDQATNGGIASTDTKTISVAIVSVKPDTIEADGNRLQAWAVTVKPTNIGRVAV